MPIGADGMSMPVTRSAMLRKGDEDGQAPTQMPQPAHRSASTCASWRTPRIGCGTMVTAAYGQSSKQRPQPLQLTGSTTAIGTGAGCDVSGSANNASSVPANANQTNAGEVE